MRSYLRGGGERRWRMDRHWVHLGVWKGIISIACYGFNQSDQQSGPMFHNFIHFYAGTNVLIDAGTLGGASLWTITLPLWMPFIGFSLLPIICAVRRLGKRPLGKAQCSTCGYDLRATPDRCPECGKTVEKAM